ncbi:MAG: BCCT family transporter, partial [Vibrio casei]
TVQIIAITLITLCALVSVLAGMDKGVKNLSLLNIALALLLMIFVFIAGPTLFILNTFMQNTGSYLSNIVERTFNLQAYVSSDWIGNWTLFIFGWTIAWAPFVGLFIAKISRGRTIRQFVVGVMVVPTIFTFLWFSVFGDTALHMIMTDGYHHIIQEVQNNNAIALFKLFERLPMTSIISFITVILIITFFVTSSDSGSLVIDSLASGGVQETPIWQRTFWVATEGVVASVLLLAGGLGALQTASVVSALPFAIIMIIAMVGMIKALRIEGHHEDSQQQYRQMQQSTSPTGKGLWKKRLANLVDFPSRDSVDNFIRITALNSMRKVEEELEAQDWEAEVTFDEEQCRAHFEVYKEGQVEFIYEIRLRAYEIPEFAANEDGDELQDEYYYRAEVFLRRGGQAYDVYNYEPQDIINDILNQFERYLHFVHISPGILPWNMEEHDDDALPEKSDT